MTVLVIGLLFFLGVHSARIVAEDWRTQIRARVGEKAWKGGYSLLSLAGLALILWGFGLARRSPTVLWTAPDWAPHLAALLTLVAFVLLAAAYVPRNGIKARLHHPMVLGIIAWAVAHLLANGTLADLLLFGSFLIWALASFIAAQSRDRAAGTAHPHGQPGATVITLAIGVLAWALFAFWAHQWLIGVRPI